MPRIGNRQFRSRNRKPRSVDLWPPSPRADTILEYEYYYDEVCYLVWVLALSMLKDGYAQFTEAIKHSSLIAG